MHIYIFRDDGRITILFQNIMTFNKCSINGKSYGDLVDETTGEIASAEDVS